MVMIDIIAVPPSIWQGDSIAGEGPKLALSLPIISSSVLIGSGCKEQLFPRKIVPKMGKRVPSARFCSGPFQASIVRRRSSIPCKRFL